jgi:hypothetical protein
MAEPGKYDYLNILKGWFERDLGRYARWDRDVELVAIERDGTVRINIFTEVHRFAISAGPSSSGRRSGYLGCTAQARKPRAGEDWARGNDLHDGPCEEATWVGILGDIISYEMVRVHKDENRKVGARGVGIVDSRADVPIATDGPIEGTVSVEAAAAAEAKYEQLKGT